MQMQSALTDLSSVRQECRVKDLLDESLIRSIAEGDKRAMQVLYARHNVKAYRFVLRLVRNVSTAEDLVSEVFLDIWRKTANFDGRSQVSTWILAIARNKALSKLRRRSAQALNDRVAETIEDPADDPELSLQKRQRASALFDCLKRLSAAHREIIDLVYYHGKSIDQVAEIISVPRNTVKTRMFYARNRLATLLAEVGLDKASSRL
jgi:RNA polymerase sigma-70 factor (ECF subfamily)